MAFSNAHFKILDLEGTQYYITSKYIMDENGTEYTWDDIRIPVVHVQTATGTFSIDDYTTLSTPFKALIEYNGNYYSYSGPDAYSGLTDYAVIRFSNNQAAKDVSVEANIFRIANDRTYSLITQALQKQIKYVELSDGNGILSQEQFDTLFNVNGYAVIAYYDGSDTALLERSSIVGVNFCWSGIFTVGSQILQKQVVINYNTKYWEYSVKEVEEFIDLIEINADNLPFQLDQTTYNTLFSSKLNKLVDIGQDNNHTRNRVYSYIEDVWDATESKLYTKYGCTYIYNGGIVHSTIAIDRSNRQCLAAVVTPTVPPGGTTHQALLKLSNTNYDYSWANVDFNTVVTGKPSINGVELIGENKAGSYYGLQNRITATGILKKTSADAAVSSAVAGTDYIAPGDSRLVKSGGTTNQVLAKTSNTDYAFDWTTINTFTIIDSSQASDTPLNVKWNDGTSDVTGTLTSQQVLANYGPKVIFAIPTSTAGTQAEGQYERSLNGGRILYVFDSNTNTFVKITATEFDVEHTHTITPTITAVSASASGVAVTNSADTFVKSYPGTFSRFEQTTVRGVSGTDTASLVSHTNATVYADIAEDSTKLGNGVLKFNINMTTTSNGNTGVSVVDSVTETSKTLAVSSSTDTTVATGSLLANATGDQVMTGLGNATTASAIINSSVTTQPTVLLNNQSSINVVTNVTETDSNYTRYHGEHSN